MKGRLAGFCAIGAAVVAAAVLAFEGSGSGQTQYVVYGKGYYWFYGLEETAGRLCWSGPDPLWCFKRDILDELPEDFPDQVVARLKRDYGLADGREDEARQVYGSVVFGHCNVAFTWFHVVGVSEDPKLAADVVNACMDLYYEFDLARRKADRARGLESARRDLPRYVDAVEKAERMLAKADGPEEEKRWRSGLESHRRMVALLEQGISRLESLDPTTNTMFKAMVRPTVATNVVDRAVRDELRRYAKAWERFEEDTRKRREAERRQKERERELNERFRKIR